MRYLDLTLPTPAENLALDEALLEEAEASGCPVEWLRLWEPPRPMVVVGRSSRIAEEVFVDACRQHDIPILRRVSGGAAVVTGPGCLMYALVLAHHHRPALRLIDQAHRFVLSTLAAALKPLVPEVQCCGTSDLALGLRKFSGNSVRCKRGHLLYHGTLLYAFPLELIDLCLRMPPRQPSYRQRRPHAAFLINLPLPRAEIRRALVTAWQATEPVTDWPRDLCRRLTNEKYGKTEWNESR